MSLTSRSPVGRVADNLPAEQGPQLHVVVVVGGAGCLGGAPQFLAQRFRSFLSFLVHARMYRNSNLDHGSTLRVRARSPSAHVSARREESGSPRTSPFFVSPFSLLPHHDYVTEHAI